MLRMVRRVRTSFANKLLCLLLVPILLFLMIAVFYVVPAAREDVYAAKRQESKDLAQVGLSVLEHYHRQEEQGSMSRQEAQAAALAVLRGSRFGPRGQDYFWINDYDHVMVMHPFRPELEGTRVREMQDPEGVYLFQEAVAEVRDEGEGYIEYQWQYFDAEERIEPKVSYVVGFEPWDWVLGNGVYLEDLRPLVTRRALTILGYIASVTALSIIITRLFAHYTVLRPVRELVHTADAINRGDLGQEVAIRSEDEIGQVGTAFNHVARLIEHVNDIVLTLDGRGQILYVSPNCRRFLGYEAWEVTGKNLSAFVHPNDRERLEQGIGALERSDRRSAFRTEETDNEYRVLHKGGAWKWMAAVSSVLNRSRDGVVILTVVRDTTARRRVEERLREEKSRVAELLAFRNEMLDTAVVWVNTLDREGNVTMWNKAAEQISGYTAQEVIGNSRVWEWLYPNAGYRQEILGRVFTIITEGDRVSDFETRIRCKDGQYRVISWHSNSLMLDGRQSGSIAVGSDVTERKAAEENLRYLSFHDSLTGLYNRAYLETEMERLDAERQYPLSLIMADLNGLKLVNDTHGHSMGDQLLQRVGQLLKTACRQEDIIARWGGDEFVVLLPQTGLDQAQAIGHRIKAESNQAYVQHIPVSMALGLACRQGKDGAVADLVRAAENNMYKNKLTESRSSKSAVLAALLRALEEKSYETQEHAVRMQSMALKMGEKLELPLSQLDQLGLLITLHDIGKINLPEEILKKESALTEEEWMQIKNHPSAGYRIALSTEDFHHVAYYILCHHEHWNGKGYPQGLQGEEIPLLSRITSIVDAYDVMVFGRPYKEALSRPEIVQEFRRCAGQQFDPSLVEVFLEVLAEKESP